MLKVSALFYELSADEVTTLPHGFQILEMNTLYKTFRVFECGKHHVKRDSFISYVSIKDLPAGFVGQKAMRQKYKKAFPAGGTV